MNHKNPMSSFSVIENNNFFNQDFYRWLTNESFSNVQLNIYDDFYTGGIEKPYNDKIVVKSKERYSLNVSGKCGGKYFGSRKCPPVLGLREDSERRL